MKTAFNQYDVVKFADGASIHSTNQHAKDYIGIVHEASDKFSYIDWYDCKSKTATREVSNLVGWIDNSELKYFGSLYHLLTDKANVLVNQVKAVAKAKVSVDVEPRVKRKYVRKPGSAKPGPKPKKDNVEKVVKAVKPVKEKKEIVTKTVKQVVKVPVPMGRYSTKMDREWFNTGRNKYCFATGKMKYFKTREMIEDSICQTNRCYLYKKINYNLDFVIVGEKPGPSKIEKLKYMNKPMISEEQWLAMIGAPGFEFDATKTNDAREEVCSALDIVMEEVK